MLCNRLIKALDTSNLQVQAIFKNKKCIKK
nr:MAG TPA: hypothetical protein [Caudoviricetes sp.]